MPLTKLQFRPGVNRETTSFANEGGWFDGDKIRFRAGVPEKIGGWIKKSGAQFQGTARALHPWSALSGENFLGIGTHLKYYIDEGGQYYDVTPIRSTTSAGGVTFSATNGSSTITATVSNHGALVNDFVTFTDTTSLGGNVTSTVLNQEYQIITVTDNTFTFTAKDTSSATVTANSSDSGNGGSSSVAAFQINTGLDTTIAGAGWGAGTWGRGTWNSAANLTALGATLRIWSHDNFGEDLIMNVRDAGIYYWDKSSGVGSRAVSLNTLAEIDDTAPTIAKLVLVSDRDRHVIAFGCDSEVAIGTQDPLLIRFSDQESILTWAARPTNTAGDLRVGSGSKIVTAVETRQQILVFTDVSLHTMQFIGPPFTFGINQVSENTTIMSPISAIAVDDRVFWMGQQEFYVYAGSVQKIPCSVRAYVFDDFNYDQAEKVTAGLNSSYSEIWWFYPSSTSDNVDRYVIYNYQEQAWYYGNLSRSVWIDRGIDRYPVAASPEGYLYQHEFGYDDGETTPASAITSFIESSQMDIGDGENFVFMRRLIPDVTFVDSTAETPSVNFILEARNFPGVDYANTSTNAVTRTATVPIEQFTTQANLRLRGRSFNLKIQSTAEGVGWRLGAPRVDIRPDGRR